MKKIFIPIIVTLVFALNVFGQDKASDVKKLFQLLNSEKMIDGMMSNMIPMLKQQASMAMEGDGAKEKLDKYIDFLMNETKELSKKLVNEEMVLIYDKHFTHEEIKDLIKFFESPTGKKMLDKTPEISNDLMNSMMTKHMPEFQEKMKKYLEEIK